ncbi:hypothetical protein ACVETS_16240 [Acinetobacter baumannii]
MPKNIHQITRQRIEIEECTFGFNQSIPAIKITVANNLTALLPRQKLFDIQIGFVA